MTRYIIAFTIIFLSAGASAQQLKQIQKGTANNQIPVTNGKQYTQEYRDAIPYILDTIGIRDSILADVLPDSIFNVSGATKDTIKLRDGEGYAIVDKALVNGVKGTGTATRVAWWGGTDSLSSSENLYWDNINTRLGVATSTPLQKLHVNGNIYAGSDYNLYVGKNTNTEGGYYNTVFGNNALNNVTSGNHNFGLGNEAGRLLTTGSYNTLIGVQNMSYCLGCSNNTAIGFHSMLNATSGNDNIGVGMFTLYNNSGSRNIAIGRAALNNNNGNNNVSIGYDSGSQNTTTGGVYLGFAAGYYEGNNNRLHISNDYTGTPLIGGIFDLGRVGINVNGTNNIARTLHVGGEVRIEDLSSDPAKNIVGSDDDGDLSNITLGSGLSMSGGTLNTVNTLSGSGSATRVAFWNGTSSLSSNSNLYWDNGNNRFGIGTTTPETDFNISAPLPELTLSTTNGNTSRHYLAGYSSGAFSIFQIATNRKPSNGSIYDSNRASAFMNMVADNSDSYFQWANTPTNGATPSIRMTLNKDGTLNISNLASSETKLVLANSSGDLTTGTFGNGLTNTGGIITANISGTQNRVAKFTSQYALGNSTIYTVGDTLVGINQSNPQYHLDVSGKFRVSQRTGTAATGAGFTSDGQLIAYNLDTALATPNTYIAAGTDINITGIGTMVDPYTVNNSAPERTRVKDSQHLDLERITNDTITGTIISGSIGASELSSTAVSAGSYTLSNITVDQDGRITSASNGNAITSINTTSPITGGNITSTGTIGIDNAAANASTKGAATFQTNDFNDNGGGLISIDYTNGQSASGSTKGFLTSTDWNTFNNKQTTLISATNIKTISSNSILGSGDLNLRWGYRTQSGTGANIISYITGNDQLIDYINGTGITIGRATGTNNVTITNTGVTSLNGLGGSMFLSTTNSGTYPNWFSSGTTLYFAMPSGSSGQVLKHNGVGWTASTDNNTDAQTLSFSSPNLSISGGNSVALPVLPTGTATSNTLRWSGSAWSETSMLKTTTARVDINSWSGTVNLGSKLLVNGHIQYTNTGFQASTITGRDSDGGLTNVPLSGMSLSSGTLTATDGSISNEGSLTVGAGSSTTSTISSNTSGSTAVTIAASVGLDISESGNTITLNTNTTQGYRYNDGSASMSLNGSTKVAMGSAASTNSTHITTSTSNSITVNTTGLYEATYSLGVTHNTAAAVTCWIDKSGSGVVPGSYSFSQNASNTVQTHTKTVALNSPTGTYQLYCFSEGSPTETIYYPYFMITKIQ